MKPYKDLTPAGKFLRRNIFRLLALAAALPLAYWGYTAAGGGRAGRNGGT